MAASQRRIASRARPQAASIATPDPYSNTGYLAPRYELKRGKEDPARFFRKTFFTWSHRGAVEAVASGLAHGHGGRPGRSAHPEADQPGWFHPRRARTL